MFLKFLGVGAAFNYQTSNNCAYFKVDKTLFLFDMGEKICDKILAMKLLDDVDNIVVLVTHLHSDHIGSLEPFLYWNHFFSKKPVRVFYPIKGNLHKLLELTGLDFPFEIYNDYSLIKEVKVEPVEVKHIDGSYGYFVYAKDINFYYSGDTSVLLPRAVKELKEGKIGEMYHEVTVSTNAMIHTHISVLEENFNQEERKKIILMHLANQETIDQGLKAGFQIAKEEKLHV